MPSRNPLPYRPPIAAEERTTLAWERSALAFVTMSGILLGGAAHRDEPWLLAPSFALLALAGLVWRFAHHRGRRAGAPRPLALMTVVVALIAVVSLVAVLQTPS
jgi:uncharacterized membrane protein YidH (DUF202 family)